jgi:biotin/methionine sulfoxide reductase
MTLERNDMGASQGDTKLVAMKRIVEPNAGARDDFEIFADIADAMGRAERFTEGLSQDQWLRTLYEPTREAMEKLGLAAPSFDEFWAAGEVEMPISPEPGPVRAFVADPAGKPLATPSGRIELFSRTVADFGYDDCKGHPSWFEPVEWLGGERAKAFPLQLVANQPPNRLHSQLDFGSASAGHKVAGREVIRINPADAKARSIVDGNLVRVFNDRGACLAIARLSESVRPRVVQLSTGAWFTPLSATNLLCTQGNPNVVTRDIGTSKLGQACCGQLTLVDISVVEGDIPMIDPYQPPIERTG